MLPQLKRPGYETEPSIDVLAKISNDQLENVENFTIKNEHAKIIFEGKTDLRTLDLDRIVNIQEKAVILYKIYLNNYLTMKIV